MKIKLTHLIIASLISLSCVSTISMSYAGSFVTKKSTYVTTSASGFNEGPITQKNYNGGVHVEVYDPQKYEKQLFLDLELDMKRISSSKVKVTVKNVSKKQYPGYKTFYIMFAYYNEPIDPSKIWYLPMFVPLPDKQYSLEVSVPCIGCNDHWQLFAWANKHVSEGLVLPEQNFHNNVVMVCRFDEDCPEDSP